MLRSLRDVSVGQGSGNLVRTSRVARDMVKAVRYVQGGLNERGNVRKIRRLPWLYSCGADIILSNQCGELMSDTLRTF